MVTSGAWIAFKDSFDCSDTAYEYMGCFVFLIPLILFTPILIITDIILSPFEITSYILAKRGDK